MVLGRRLVLRKAKPPKSRHAPLKNFMPSMCLSVLPNENFFDPATVCVSLSFSTEELQRISMLPLHGHILFEPEHSGAKCNMRCPHLIGDNILDGFNLDTLSLVNLLRMPFVTSIEVYTDDLLNLYNTGKQHLVSLHKGNHMPLDTDPVSFPVCASNEPSLLEWTAVEWNIPPVVEEDQISLSIMDLHHTVLVKKVYDRLFKSLNYRRPSMTSITAEVSISNLPLESLAIENYYDDVVDIPPFSSGKTWIKKKLNKKLNRRKSHTLYKGRSVKKKRKTTKPLSQFYDVPLQKMRISKKIISPSSVSDSDFIKRNKQFIEDHALPQNSMEEKASEVLELDMRLGLRSIKGEQEALKGLSESIARHRESYNNLTKR